MTSTMKKMTCRALVVSLLALSFQTANAGMIGAEQTMPAQSASAERSMIIHMLDRADTVAQLQARGVDPQAARDRVAAMTDQEVLAMSKDIQTAPAGALSSGGWVAVVVVLAAIWYFAYRK